MSSTALPSVDLSTATPGSKGSVLLQVGQQPITAGGHLRLHNESGCTLAMAEQQSHDSFWLPPGGWTTVELQQNESGIDYLVSSILPGAGVSKLYATYYGPGTDVPDLQRGNSPLAVSGTVTVVGNILQADDENTYSISGAYVEMTGTRITIPVSGTYMLLCYWYAYATTDPAPLSEQVFGIVLRNGSRPPGLISANTTLLTTTPWSLAWVYALHLTAGDIVSLAANNSLGGHTIVEGSAKLVVQYVGS